MIEYYCKLASKIVPKDQNDLTKRKDIQYFYITKSGQQRNHDGYVNVLNENNFLHTLNGWDSIKNFFPKK